MAHVYVAPLQRGWVREADMAKVKATNVALGTLAAYVGREFVSAPGPDAPKDFVRPGEQPNTLF